MMLPSSPWSTRPIRTVAPTADPIDIDEVKQHLRVWHTDEDILITGLIAAAVAHFDGWSGILGRCLVTQTWTVGLSRFPAEAAIALPFPDVQSVTVTYRDGANASQTLSSSAYALIQTTAGSALVLNSASEWPDTFDRQDAVTIAMVAGYGDANAVPQSIKQAMLLLIGHWFANREALAAAGTMTEIPMAVSALISPYRFC
jgi:uncharacterized phiE125 gp8 family phage protein